MKPPAPTRKTLIFHAVSRARDDARTPEAPPVRPSERPTVPSVHAVDEHDSVLELSASHLESGDYSDAAPSVPGPSSGSGPNAEPSTARGSTTRARDSIDDAMRALGGLPRYLLATLAVRTTAASLVAGAAVVALLAGGLRPGDASLSRVAAAGGARVTRASASELTPLASRTSEAVGPPPAGGCANAGPPRVLASRAHIPSGIDVSAFESGFGIGFASAPGEAVGLRVDGSLTREADRVRVRTTGAVVKHVVVDPARDDGDGELDVRVDVEDARTVVVEGEPGAVRLRVTGDRLHVASAGKERGTWLVPGATPNPAPLRGRPRAPGIVVPPLDLRAAPRDGGGVVVVMRRGSAMWIGLLDHELAPEGPLVVLARGGVTTGVPAVSAYGGGAAVAWAERKIGEKEWSVVAASIGGPDDEVHEVRTIGLGMSPSLASLPDGDLLLAYAEGSAGAHRVVARKLARDQALAPRGEPVVVSPAELNAGQPAAVVAGDGRGLVAFFAAGSGRATLVARPLACDPGL